MPVNGTSVGYALYHQLGTARMPQRPPLRVSSAFMTVVGKDMNAFMQEVWKARRAELIADVTTAS